MTAQDYLSAHGINDESIKRFHLSWDDNFLRIPIKNKDDKIIWTKQRNLNFNPDDPESKKYVNEHGTKAALFNIRSHFDKKSLILCEGEIDAIRLDQLGIPAISTTAGAGSFNQEFADELKDKKIYLVYDNDSAGKEGINKVLEFLPEAKILELPLDSHDICDFFVLHSKSEFVDIIKASYTKEEWALKYQPPEFSSLTVKELYEREYPPEDYIIDKFIPQTGFTMFSGDSGVGKSWVALEIVRAISNNDFFLDHFEIKIPNVPILIIDKENGLRRLQARMKSIGVAPSDSVYLLQYPEKFDLTNGEFMESIQNLIIAKQIGIVILDSFIDVMIGDESSSTETAKVFNSLRSISSAICWVILHHESRPTPKLIKTGGERYRGSTNIKAQLDYLFSIQATKSPKTIHIEQGKARDYEMMNKFAIEFLTIPETGEMGGFKYMGEVKEEIKQIEEAQEFIFEYLTDHTMASIEDMDLIAQERNLTARTMKDARRQMTKKGIIDWTKQPFKGNIHFYFLVADNNTMVDSDSESS